MIPVEVANSFDRVLERERERGARREEVLALSDDEIIALEYLDAAVESKVRLEFDGVCAFALLIDESMAHPRVVEALCRRWEDGGWLMKAQIGRHSVDGRERFAVQIVLLPAHSSLPAASTRALSTPVVESPPRRPRSPGEKPRVLLVPDVPGWAFDVNARDLAEYLKDKFEFGFFYTENFFRGERAKWSEWDVVYEFFHRNPSMGLPHDRSVGALRSEWWDPQKREPPTAEQIATVNRYRGFQVACRRNLDEFRPHCPGVVYLTNPVNTRRFQLSAPKDRIVASWNGNAGHKSPDGRYIKHYYDIVMPAAMRAGTPLVVAEYGTKDGPQRRRMPSEMPAFYQQANVALCASEYESASNSVMEAMASGLALIATDVGNHRELRDSQVKDFGDTGIILVEPDVNAFAAALRELTPERARQMGEINRAEIEARWSWSVWADEYRLFLEMAL